MRNRIALLLVGVTAAGLLAVAVPSAYVFQGTSSWPSGSSVPMYLQLGAAPRALIDGARSWDEVAASAVSIWDRQLVSIDFISRIENRARLAGDGINDVFFADDVFGDAFGPDSIAVTSIWGRGSIRTEGNVIFNRAKSWDSYRGPRRGSPVDFRRVLLHALGHVLGLGHPDLDGQSVSAIMNSESHPAGAVVDDLQEDDIRGARALYGGPPQPSTARLVSTPREDRVAFRRDIESTYRRVGARLKRTFVDFDGTAIWNAEYLWYRVSYCDHATATARVFAQIEGRGVQPVCAEPASLELFPTLADGDLFRDALEAEYRDVLRRSANEYYLDPDDDALWMASYVKFRFQGLDHAQATAKVVGYFDAPATPAPPRAPAPPTGIAPRNPQTAEAFCATLPSIGFGSWFYCGSPQTNLQGGLPNGWLGYCQAPAENLGTAGYSATTFAGGADLVRSFSGAQDMCNMLNLGGLRQCGSIIQCTRQ